MICILKSTIDISDCCLPLVSLKWEVSDATGTIIYSVTGLDTDSGTQPSTPFVGGTLGEPQFDFSLLAGRPSPVTITRTVKDSCCNENSYSQQFEANNIGQFNCDNCDETPTTLNVSGTTGTIVFTNENFDEYPINITSSGDTILVTSDPSTNTVNLEINDTYITGTTTTTGVVTLVDNDPNTPNVDIDVCDAMVGCEILTISGDTGSNILQVGDTIIITSSGNTITTSFEGDIINIEAKQFECNDLSGCSIDSLQDVVLTNIQEGDVLILSGDTFINQQPADTLITNITLVNSDPLDPTDPSLDCSQYSVGQYLYLGDDFCPEYIYKIFSDGAGGCKTVLISKPDGATSNISS